MFASVSDFFTEKRNGDYEAFPALPRKNNEYRKKVPSQQLTWDFPTSRLFIPHVYLNFGFRKLASAGAAPDAFIEVRIAAEFPPASVHNQAYY